MGRVQQKGTGQMVPMARGADLDDVTGEIAFLGPLREGLEFLRRGDAAAEGRKSRTEDIGHEDEGVFLADRAVLRGRLTDLSGRPNQFRMGVAHLVLRQPSLLELRDEVLSREPVIDLAALATRGTAERS